MLGKGVGVFLWVFFVGFWVLVFFLVNRDYLFFRVVLKILWNDVFEVFCKLLYLIDNLVNISSLKSYVVDKNKSFCFLWKEFLVL